MDSSMDVDSICLPRHVSGDAGHGGWTTGGCNKRQLAKLAINVYN